MCLSPSSDTSSELPLPPTPPPRRAGSFRLLSRRDDETGLMSRLAASLRFSPLPGLAVSGMVDPAASPLGTHRASYHGPSKYAPELNGVEVPNHMHKYNPEEKVIGSAENLVGRVLQEQGLGRYCDPEFVKATQRELAEAINLTPEELDMAAHRLLHPPGEGESRL